MYEIKKLTLLDDIFTHEHYATASTLQEAKDLLPTIVCIEEDAKHPNYYDAFTISGEVFTIEPQEV